MLRRTDISEPSVIGWVEDEVRPVLAIDDLTGEHHFITDLHADFDGLIIDGHGHRLWTRAGPEIQTSRHQPRQPQPLQQPWQRQIFAIRDKMRFVIMAKQLAISIHGRHTIARGNELPLFNYKAVGACYQHIIITHQRRQPRSAAGRAVARLTLIITIGIAFLQIVRNGGLRPQDQARALVGQGAAVHRQLGKVHCVIAQSIFVRLRDIGLHHRDRDGLRMCRRAAVISAPKRKAPDDRGRDQYAEQNATNGIACPPAFGALAGYGLCPQRRKLVDTTYSQNDDS